MASIRYARQADTCPEGTAFYKCAVGPFIGCCSRDPCDTGVCRDVDNCNSNPPPEGQDSTAKTTQEQTTTLTVTVSQGIRSLTATVTISDIVTSIITAPASATLKAVPSSSALNSHTSDPSTIPSGSTGSLTSSHLLTGSMWTETQVSSIPATIANATATTSDITTSDKTSSWMTQSSSAPSNPTISNAPHTTAIVGGTVGGLSLLALLAFLFLCCCCRRRAKYGFSVKRKSKEDKEEQERAELLRKAEEAVLQRQAFLGTAISTGAESPVIGGTADAGPSPYPRNSTAIPPQHWI
jgi:hypothetical protein